MILALLFLILAGCNSETIILEEISNIDITGMTVAEPTEEDTAPYYDFTEGETKTILGRDITISDIQQTPEIYLLVDGVSGKLLETKKEEIVNYLRISINKIDLTDINNKKVTLKIEDINIENNQYVLIKNTKTTIENRDIILTESRSNGNIEVTVYETNTNKGDDAQIASGETVEIYGLTITNIENYYRISQYALISVQES